MMIPSAPDAVSTVVLRAWLDGLALPPSEQAALVGHLSLSPAMLEQHDILVDRARLADLVKWAVARDGRSTGLRAASSLPRGAFAVVEYLMRTADDLRSAVDYLLRYQRLLGSPEMFTAVGNGAFHVVLAPSPGLHGEVEATVAEFSLAGIAQLARRATVRPWQPLAVRFGHAAPGPREPYRRVFGCAVEFGADRTELVIPEGALTLAMREADPRLRTLIERCAGSVGNGGGVNLADAVRRFVATRLPTGAPDLADTAANLDMSARVLQNRLRDDGMSYSEVVEDVRRTLAVRYLADDELGTQEIALLLGYSEASAFYRAFKRWTGSTPGQFRRTARRRRARPPRTRS